MIINDPIEGIDFPGGKVQEGEDDLEEAFRREVREETNLEIEIGHPFVTWLNEFPSQHRHAGKKVFLVGYRCKIAGGEIKLSHEHDSYRWVDKDNFLEVDDGSEFFAALKKYFLL